MFPSKKKPALFHSSVIEIELLKVRTHSSIYIAERMHNSLNNGFQKAKLDISTINDNALLTVRLKAIKIPLKRMNLFYQPSDT